ncbi:MAG: hypothetical protein PHR36_02390 [Patescibacteria group bacterium]|nr:hypothetical protein [Patescibacteria group bacterium]
MDNLEILAKRIEKETGFKIAEKIYQGDYYSRAKIRNIIYAGTYKNKPAVLKIYNDPRETDEPKALLNFNKINKSRKITAPKLYQYKIISPNEGWLIMEKLPAGTKYFKSPLNKKERKEFLDLYLEYRKNFPKIPHRKLSLVETLPAGEYHIFRINRWLHLANSKEGKEKKTVLKTAEFIPRYKMAMELIRREFSHRRMSWGHGHFKPKEIFKVSDELYYLTDFAHTKMYPEGYELAFIIWADYMIAGNWKLPYHKWERGIKDWLEDIKPIARKLKIKRFNSLIRASLIERVMGCILADVVASDRPRIEKIKRINLLYNLFDDLI